ncbi:hypothetical protein FACS1894137_13190 [Spirochaetia bacterium]|nr:hypothetical protein FACS1894137_13190 [Spirochaetia bacterium]
MKKGVEVMVLDDVSDWGGSMKKQVEMVNLKKQTIIEDLHRQMEKVQESINYYKTKHHLSDALKNEAWAYLIDVKLIQDGLISISENFDSLIKAPFSMKQAVLVVENLHKQMERVQEKINLFETNVILSDAVKNEVLYHLHIVRYVQEEFFRIHEIDSRFINNIRKTTEIKLAEDNKRLNNLNNEYRELISKLVKGYERKEEIGHRCFSLQDKLDVEKDKAQIEIVQQIRNGAEDTFRLLITATISCETAAGCTLGEEDSMKQFVELESRIEDLENQIVQNTKMKTKRFKVALSFPGEYRAIIEKIANILAVHFSKDGILYDKFHSEEFARPDLDKHLQKLYHDESELIVVCLCGKYNESEWCGLEWKAIRDLRNGKDNGDKIMFLRTDNGNVDGVFGTTDGYLQITDSNIAEVASGIIKRHSML